MATAAERLGGERQGDSSIVASGRPGELRRHHDRVVRLLPLRHRRGAGLRRPVLPERRSDVGTLAAFATFGVGFAARPIGGDHLRPLRRPRRTQVDARDLAADHGRRHGRDRPAADLRVDRHRRPDRCSSCCASPGHRRRRRVGRRGADGRRARAEGQARPLRQLPADGRAGRPALSTVVFAVMQALTTEQQFTLVGLAHPVPVLDRARRRRPVHPHADHGVAGVPARSRTAAPRRRSRSSTSSRRTRARSSSRWACGSPRTASSTSTPCSSWPTPRTR